MFVAERIAAKSKYAGKLYLQFQPEESWDRPGCRAFGRVNGGLVFEAAYIRDTESVPMLSVFYADKSHWKGMSHHPIYGTYSTYETYFAYFTYLQYITYCTDILCSESLLNIMEDYRAQPSSWYAVGWMPIVDEEKSLRPGSGYDSAGARNMRIHQECWRHFLKRYITDAKDSRIIFYGDGKARKTRHSIGAVLGDQQV